MKNNWFLRLSLIQNYFKGVTGESGINPLTYFPSDTFSRAEVKNSTEIHVTFRTSIPHQKITTDTTEFKYYEEGIQKKCYLNPYIDLFNSEVISYHISKQPSYQSIDIALNKALAVTSDCPYRRTFHSDQGWGYQMRDYVSKLKSHRIFQSMSRKGNCHDNSVMDNFFGLLKQEIYYGYIFSSFEELEQVIVIWIKYYNTKRIKQKLNWMSPIQFRLNYQNN